MFSIFLAIIKRWLWSLNTCTFLKAMAIKIRHCQLMIIITLHSKTKAFFLWAKLMDFPRLLHSVACPVIVFQILRNKTSLRPLCGISSMTRGAWHEIKAWMDVLGQHCTSSQLKTQNMCVTHKDKRNGFKMRKKVGYLNENCIFAH